MKISKKKSTLSIFLIYSLCFQSCAPKENPLPKESRIMIPATSPSPIETIKPASTGDEKNDIKPSVNTIPSAIPTTITPSVIPSIVTPKNKTYLIPLELNGGKITAYVTYVSDTYGKILVNFQDISDMPTKIQLIDQFGNNIISSNAFNIAMAGNFNSNFYKQIEQKIKKIQVFFANGKMIEADINESFLSNLTEATPIPPNPTPVATPSISTNYQQTYIQPFHFNKGIVTTIAGTNQYDYLDGSALSSRFRNPQDVVVDKNGNIYIADTSNYKIRKIAPNGTVTTLAGSSSGYVNGQGANAKFRSPTRIAVDSIGNIYVTDTGNHRIRKITPDGTVTTLAGSTNGYADGVGTAAKFYSPSGIAVDSIGNVYVADTGNHRIRKITPDGTVTTLAGTNISDYADGVGENAQFTYLYGIAVDNKGNLFTTEGDSEGGGYHVIRKTTPNGTVTTIAGSTTGDRGYQDGVGTDALFMDPSDLTVDNYGNIYVVDSSNSVIRKIDSNLNVTTLAGNSINGFADGTGSDAKFYYPQGITMDSFGNLYVADASNYRIRKIE